MARGCTTHKAACGIETSPMMTMSPVPNRCTTHKAACGIETKHYSFIFLLNSAAPPTKPRAALKRTVHRGQLQRRCCCTTHKAACGIETCPNVSIWHSILRCTTHKAACGIETSMFFALIRSFSSCTTHKAACGIETLFSGISRGATDRLHHPQSRVRHERPHRLAALATSPASAGEAKIQ